MIDVPSMSITLPSKGLVFSALASHNNPNAFISRAVAVGGGGGDFPSEGCGREG
jgi:hypothetical protein